MFTDITLGTIWIGEVLNSEDPLSLGRVKIAVFGKFDELSEDVIPWAIPYNQLASGTVIIPKKGEVCNVFFENGDENVPFYTGIAKTNDDLLSEFGEDYPSVWSIVYDKTIGEEKSLEIFYTDTQGLMIRKSNSLINIKNEDESVIITNGKTKKSIHISDDGISLGTEGKSAESAVLGDTLETLLNDFITELGKIGAIPTPAGPSGTLSSSPLWTPLVAKFKTDWETMKSQLVSLDK
tara:strand:+ start:6718 stop:7428 length:711 start_codon:yes stop_codon:yes gene_type:complete